MSATPWHKRYHEDALGGYMGLSLEERGAYTTLLDLLYKHGEALLDNERLIAGWMQCSVRKYRQLRDRLIAFGKIVRREDGRLTNPRFERECETAREVGRKRAESGEIGGRNSGEARKKAKENKAPPKQTLPAERSYLRSSETQKDSSEREEKVIEVVVPADAGSPPPRYAFEATTIRLTHEHLALWRKAHPHVALESELWALDEWAGELHRQGKNWFMAVSAALAKREREAFQRVQMRQAELRAPPRMHVDGRI
jgi:uncharacterized protein YdaU (DUF1376 family)